MERWIGNALQACQSVHSQLALSVVTVSSGATASMMQIIPQICLARRRARAARGRSKRILPGLTLVIVCASGTTETVCHKTQLDAVPDIRGSMPQLGAGATELRADGVGLVGRSPSKDGPAAPQHRLRWE